MTKEAYLVGQTGRMKKEGKENKMETISGEGKRRMGVRMSGM